MKRVCLLLFISLVSLCFTAESNALCESTITPSDKSVCHQSTLSEGYYKCCFESYKILVVGYTACIPVSKETFDNIGDYISIRKAALANLGDYSFDCASNYLFLSLASLLLLLFL